MENENTAGKSRKDKDDDKPYSAGKEILSWIEIIVVAALIAFCLNTFIIANSRVPSASMENTIMTGDRVIGSRLTYKFFTDPKRGDIIIFKWPDDEKILFVKRIIGMPGDTVEIRNNHVYLNGSSEPLDEPYLKEPMKRNENLTFTVPENAYFCMGDNRNNSADARYWKNTFVYRNKIISKVEFRYFPGFKKLK
jgi:signal peptidase I